MFTEQYLSIVNVDVFAIVKVKLTLYQHLVLK